MTTKPPPLWPLTCAFLLKFKLNYWLNVNLRIFTTPKVVHWMIPNLSIFTAPKNAFQILRARALCLFLHERNPRRDDRDQEGSTLQHDLLGKKLALCWHLIAFPSTPDFLCKVGLTLALGLVTSCCSHQTACWRSASCWLGWGSRSIGDPSKSH